MEARERHQQNLIPVVDPGESSPYFLIKLRPEGPKKIFLETAPPPPPLLDDWPPLYLKVWIWHWIQLMCHFKLR